MTKKYGKQKIKTYSKPIKATASNIQAKGRQPANLKPVIKSALKKVNFLVDMRGEKISNNGVYGRKI